MLDQNPLDSIQHSESVNMVMANGRLYVRDFDEIVSFDVSTPAVEDAREAGGSR